MEMEAVRPLRMEDTHLSLNSTISRAANLVASELDNEVVMMSIELGEYYGFGKIGSEIWRQLDKPITVKSIVGYFTDKYDVSIAQCQQDVLDFMQQLNAKGLIHISN